MLTIFHTSDLHNKLNQALAGRLRELKQSHPGSLMLDSGDAIWAGNIFWRPGGEPVFDLMNSVPYDAMCVGNREYHFLAMGMQSKVSRADFPMLSANLRASKDDLELPARPYAVFEREGLRIGVIGLSVPCITERMKVKKISDYYFTDPIAAAEEIVPMIRDEIDILVALTHIGIKRDRELARRVRGIDLILGGHTHALTEEPEVYGDTMLMHHEYFAHYVGKVEIAKENGGIFIKHELIKLGKA